MKVTYKWLKEFVDFDLSPEELADRLTMLGIEVTGLEYPGRSYSGIVVGKVLSKGRHPDADRLSVCKVAIGDEVLEVVCGAPNVEPEQKVPVATPGSRLPDGRVIERVSIRGVDSNGMICSEAELGLGDDSSGIMVLPESLEVGTPLDRALGLDDVVIELDLTPNRPDCLGVVGVAREVAIACGSELRIPEYRVRETDVDVDRLASVEIADVAGCPRYSARVVTGVSVGPSPEWMRRRLELVGLRSINNVVDATNYVLMELGHPLHAFDYDRVADHRIIVRRALEGEEIVTLDGVERRLDGDILVIADSSRCIAIAGIMGGLNTEVTDGTTSVLLESAYFSPKVVRMGARKLGLSTEASRRFERGADYGGIVRALDRTAQLLSEVAGGSSARGVIDVYPAPMEPPEITLREDFPGRILGTPIDRNTARSVLIGLGCRVENSGDGLKVKPPTFRPDLEREIDLVEEIARVYNYDRIETIERLSGALPDRPDITELAEERTREVMVGLGLCEVINNSLVDPDLIKIVNPDDTPVPLSNPSSKAMSVLRTRLLPGLLDTARRNLNQKVEDIRIFEIGRVFGWSGERRVSERTELAALITGPRRTASWDEKALSVDFYDLKAILELYISRISLDKLEFMNYDDSDQGYDPAFSASVSLGGEQIGACGKVKNEVLEKLDIKGEVYCFTLSFDRLLKHISFERRVRPLPVYPAVERDLAVILDEDVAWADVKEAVLSVDRELVESVELFDLYRGSQIPQGKKSMAFSLRFRWSEGTLSDDEAERLCQEILSRLGEKFGAVLRS